MDKHNSRYKYGRRRSRSLGGILNAKEVCKTLRKSLSSSQKLQLLLQYAFEHSLAMAEKDLTQDLDDVTIRKSVGGCQVNFESKIEELNYCSLAVADNGLANVNASLGEKHKQYKSAEAKLEDESKQWDELLAKYRSNLNRATDVTDIQLKSKFCFEKFQHLDYSKVFESVQASDCRINQEIDKLNCTSNFLRKYAKLTNRGISLLATDAGKIRLNTFEDTPRKLIKKCYLD